MKKPEFTRRIIDRMIEEIEHMTEGVATIPKESMKNVYTKACFLVGVYNKALASGTLSRDAREKLTVLRARLSAKLPELREQCAKTQTL